MTVSRGFVVDRRTKLEMLRNGIRTKIEYFTDFSYYFAVAQLRFVRPKRIHKKAYRFCNSNRIGYLYRCFIRNAGGNKVFRQMACYISA